MGLIRRERRQWTAEPWIPPFPGMSGPGSASTTSALQMSAVWACVRLVADTVSMMDLHAFTMKQGVRVPIPDPPLLTMPSSDATLPEWLYMIISSLMLRGNAFGQVVKRDSQMYPVQIDLVNPDQVRVRKQDGTNRLAYAFNGVDVPWDNVMHIRAYRMPGSAMGLSPIQYAATTINRDAAIQAFSLGYFNDAPNPKAVLTSDQPIGDQQARTLKERIKARLDGRDILVLGAGAKLQPLSVSPEESQFLQTQNSSIADIARIYGVPPEMIASAVQGKGITYANIQAKGIDFLTYSIQSWLSKLETAISQLIPGGKHVRFDPSVLLRVDLPTMMTATAIGIASKQLTPDEARAMQDRAPLTQQQKDLLALVPLEVSPTGKPKLLPVPEGQPSEPSPTEEPAA